MAKSDLAHYLASRAKLVEKELELVLGRYTEAPDDLREAMSYSLFAGGKRLRPLLVMAAAECCGLPARKALKTAAALEMIHTYSLIHDDLPAMDDDDLRRGKPTNHKVFGEALAILAGDALLTHAFEAAAENAAALRLTGPATSALLKSLVAGAGAEGMVGGQAADLKAEGFDMTHLNGNRERLSTLLEYIHRRKTAALIASSLEAGAILAKAGPTARNILRRYGETIGLAFQIADDILDVVGDKTLLGKSGSDQENQKLTYASLHGIEKAKLLQAELVRQAHDTIKPLGKRSAMLHELADYVIRRKK